MAKVGRGLDGSRRVSYTACMAMGKRPTARQALPMWVHSEDLPTSDGHPFFERLNRILEESGFDAFVERLCSSFYAERLGRPSLQPGRYFRLLFIGFFEGVSSERGIAWRVADSLSLRSCVDASAIASSFFVISFLFLSSAASISRLQRSGFRSPSVLPLKNGQPSGWPTRVSRTAGRGGHPGGAGAERRSREAA